jgi:hypothetical protein
VHGIPSRIPVSAEQRQGERANGGLGESPHSPSRIDLAGDVNLQIREIGRSLGITVDASEVLTFFCECGCFAAVSLTPGAFDAAGGAWLDGHRPGSRS